MIARQRSVLNRTFVHEQDAPVSEEVVRRLAKSQQELVAATDAFASGIGQRGEAIPALDDAVAAMKLSKDALAAKHLGDARPQEERALAALVSARQNLRKLLSQSNSQQANACRTFDRQEQQNLRRPPSDDKKRQLANLENDLRKLAKAERAFSEEIEPKARANQPGEKPPDTSSTDRVHRQQEAVKEIERLRELAQQDESLTDRTRQRLGEIRETIRKSADELQAMRPAEAAERAGTAADQLERTARQVGALKAGELADQMARTRDIARELSISQRKLADALRAGPTQAGEKVEGSWPRRERDLAQEASSMGELMDRLREEAAAVDAQLGLTLNETARSNPIQGIEQVMQQSAQEAEAGRQSTARKNAENATQKLDELARGLESSRRRLVQPQLDRLRAQEKLAARAQEQLSAVRNGAQQAQAEQALANLARGLETLASGDAALREATDRLNQVLGPGANREWRRDDARAPQGSGLFIPPTDFTEGLRQVSLALQARIQQLVLDQALMERDEAVPPRYKTLVEDYYRVLSQDLR